MNTTTEVRKICTVLFSLHILHILNNVLDAFLKIRLLRLTLLNRNEVPVNLRGVIRPAVMWVNLHTEKIIKETKYRPIDIIHVFIYE